MKISTKRDALFAQLQTVTRAASTRSAVQALSGVQLQAKGGAIELRATDMEIGLRVPLEGDIVREGAVVLPARLLVDVVRALPAADVTLELRPSEQDVEIVAGSTTAPSRATSPSSGTRRPISMSVARSSIAPPRAWMSTPESACTALRVDAARVTVWSCAKSASRRVVSFIAPASPSRHR